jgi:regulator of protease activity HflC (stomatin/prohibitin superfamily)
MSNKSGQAVVVTISTIFILMLIFGLIAAGMVGCPRYNVYEQRMAGEAQLAHAQASKEVAVAEAKAKMESAVLLAQAEVSRAEGVAKANKIIGDSLKGNEAYLRYLWITDVAGANQGKTVVYVPTEANLPILEASRHSEVKQ